MIGVIQNGLDEIYDLQFRKNNFFDGNPQIVIFILGIFTHWVYFLQIK